MGLLNDLERLGIFYASECSPRAVSCKGYTRGRKRNRQFETAKVEDTVGALIPAFACQICKDRVKMNVMELRAHYQTLHEDVKLPRAAQYFQMYTCDVCGKYFKWGKGYGSHMEKHDRIYDCETCGAIFRKLLDYTLHMHTHCDQKLFRCIHCDYTTSKVAEITNHLKPKHKAIKHKYICEICKKTFELHTWFKEHGNYHSGERPFNCELCDKHFLYTRHLSAHKLYVHKQDAPRTPTLNVCKICGKKYRHRNSLRLHMNVHAGKVHMCDVCGKQMATMESLKFHLRSHTGYKPYECSYCAKAFIKKQLLDEHERIHTGAKPYACHYCKKAFSQRSSLVIHIRGHTGERPYACHICGKEFVAKAVFNVHFKKCRGY